MSRYSSFTPHADHARMVSDDSMLTHHDPVELAARLAAARDATGADCLSLRLNLPGTGPTAVREQLARFGTEVLPLLRG